MNNDFHWTVMFTMAIFYISDLNEFVKKIN